MQFLKILFWCLLAFLAAMFTFSNWVTVPIKLWGGLIAEVNLPLLLVSVFLLGLIPMLVLHQTVRWRLRQRLATTQNTIEVLRGTNATPATTLIADPEPVPPPTTVLGAVPPGGA